MNYFYHEFAPGFNWVYVVAPLWLVIAALFGYFFGTRVKKYRRFSHDRVRGIKRTEVRIDKEGIMKTSVCSDTVDRLLGMASGVAIGCMTMVECGDGIIQHFDNGLGAYDSPIWSLFMAGLIIVMAAAIYGFVATVLFGMAKAEKRKVIRRRFGKIYKIKVRKGRDFSEIFQILFKKCEVMELRRVDR